MRVDVLRRQLAAGLEAAMRTRDAAAIGLTADRAKAMAIALAGRSDEEEIEIAGLDLSTRHAASALGFHPEHVRRLIRGGRLRARRAGVDYRISVDDLWPLLEARYREPGRRRPKPRR
jgi:excisionase family DNA binding protein